MTDTELLVTGPEMIRAGARGIDPVAQELLSQARREIQILAYVITPSAGQILDRVEEAAQRKVAVTIIVNRAVDVDHKTLERFRVLGRTWPKFRLLEYSKGNGNQLHAKVLICDRNQAILGSANLTWGGLVTNTEFGALLTGELAWHLAEMVDMIAGQSHIIAEVER